MAALQFSLRELAAFVGRSALFWGSVTLCSGLAIFALDLAFALALQRFLVAVGLIESLRMPPIFGPAGGPMQEAALFLVVGMLRAGVSWLNALATGMCHAVFEGGKRRSIAQSALHSGRAALGDTMTLFNDAVVGSAAAVSNLFFLASRAILMTGTLVVLAYYSWQLTGFILLIVVLAAPLQRILNARLSRVSSTIQASLADAVSRLVAGVKNGVFLQIHGLVGAEVKRIGAQVDGYRAATERYYAYSATRAILPQFLGLVVVAGVAVYGTMLLGDDKGGVVAYLYLTLRLFQSLGEVARVTANLRLNWPRLRVLHRWWRAEFAPAQLAIESDLGRTHEPEPFPQPVGWRCRDVSFGWPGSPPLTEGLSFEIPAGSATVIVGASGVGKTSLLLLLGGLLTPTTGTIRLLVSGDERPIAPERDRLLASAAYVGPDPFAVPGTIREFLMLGVQGARSDDEIHAALSRACCDFVQLLTGRLNHVVTEQGGGLSAGQKQRLALARAFLRRPRVLLLDEATANLDAESERAVVDALRRLKGEMTIVAVTHREALLTIADRVVDLDAAAKPAPMLAQVRS